VVNIIDSFSIVENGDILECPLRIQLNTVFIDYILIISKTVLGVRSYSFLYDPEEA